MTLSSPEIQEEEEEEEEEKDWVVRCARSRPASLASVLQSS